MRTSITTFCTVVILAAAAPAETDAQRWRRMIDETEAQRFAEILRLTDEQRPIVMSLHADYVTQWEDKFSDMARQYSADERAATEAVNRGPGNPGELAARLYPALDARLRDLNTLLAAEDDAFLSAVGAILTEEQVPRMIHVRHAIARRIYRVYDSVLPEDHLDLVALLDSLELPEHERELLDADFRARYETELVAALEHRYRTAFEIANQHYRVVEQQYEYDHASPDATQRERLIDDIWRRGRQMALRKIAASERIVHANRMGLQALQTILPTETWTLVWRTYKQRAYPEVYPDPVSADRIFALALALEELDDYQREAIENQRRIYTQQHERLSLQMEKLLEELLKTRALVRRGDLHEATIARDRLNRAGETRERLNDDQITHLMGVLSTEQFAQLPDWDFIKNPPPRPWDPRYEAARRAAEQDDE